MYKMLGIALAVIAVGLAVVPNFTDCQSHGGMITLANGNQISMKCHWTGVAEIPVGVGLFGAGAMMTFNRRRGALLSLSIMGLIIGAMALAVPSGLIGTCATPTMTCNTVMKPALLSIGSLAVVGSAVGLIMSRKAAE